MYFSKHGHSQLFSFQDITFLWVFPLARAEINDCCAVHLYSFITKRQSSTFTDLHYITRKTTYMAQRSRSGNPDLFSFDWCTHTNDGPCKQEGLSKHIYTVHNLSCILLAHIEVMASPEQNRDGLKSKIILTKTNEINHSDVLQSLNFHQR